MNNELYVILLRWALSGAVISIVLLLLRRRITNWLQGSGEDSAGPTSGFLRRGLAFYLDQGLFFWPSQILLWVLPLSKPVESIVLSVFLCAFVVYKILMESRRGQTPGKWLLGLRVQGPGGNPSLYAAWGRNSLLLVLALASFNMPALLRPDLAVMDPGSVPMLILALTVLLFGFLLVDVFWYFRQRGHRMYHDIATDTSVVPSGSIRPLFFWLLLAFILLGNLEKALEGAILP